MHLSTAFRATLLLLAAIPAPAQEGFFADGVDSATVPLRLLSNGNLPGLPVVAVRIGERTAWFMVDSGFNSVAIDAELARELELEQRGSDVMLGIGGASKVPLFRGEPLHIGAAELVAPIFYGPNLPGFCRDRDVRIRGLLGAPLFGTFAVTIDYPAAQVTLRRLDDVRAPAGATALPLAGALGQLEVRASIGGGRAYRFMLDTGAEPAVLLNAPFVARHGLLASIEAAAPAMAIDGLSGSGEVHLGRLPSLRLGDLELPAVPAWLLEEGQAFGLGSDRRRIGILGTGLLKAFRVTFDTRHRRVYLEAGSEPPRIDAASGIALARREGRLEVVLQVHADGVEPTLESGDVIVAIDGGETPDDLGALYARLRTGARVVFTVERDGKRLDVPFARPDDPPLVEPAAGW